jgi:hypothetical protein
MLQVILNLEEYTPTDLKHLNLLVEIATAKGYLMQREPYWFLKMIEKGEAIGVKNNGLLVGYSVLSPIVFQNGQLNAIMYGVVWREKYNGDQLIFSETLCIAKTKFNSTYAVVRKSNSKSLNICKSYGAHVIEHRNIVEPLILNSELYNKDNTFLLCFN